MSIVDSTLVQCLIDRNPHPTFLLGVPAGQILAANRAASQFFQKSSNSIQRLSFHTLLDVPAPGPVSAFLAGSPSYDKKLFEDLFMTLQDGRRMVFVAEFERLTHDGESCALVTLKPTMTAEPDVSGRVDSLFLDIFDHCPIPLVLATREGINIRINKSFAGLVGFSPEEVVGRSALELNFWHDPEERESVQRLLKEGGRVDNFEAILRKRDGSTMTCLLSMRLIPDQGQQRIITSLQDITQLKKAQEALLASERIFRDFFQSNPIATIISSPDGKILMVNPAFTKTTGFPAADVVGRTVQEMGFWQDPQDREHMVNSIRENGCLDDKEGRFWGKGMRPMTCIISSRAIVQDEEIRILSTVHDITEQKKVEDALLRIDQAKSLFVSTTAHELRTPLAAIIGYAELLANTDFDGFSEEQKQVFASVILSNAEILHRLADDLLDIECVQMGQPLSTIQTEVEIGSIIEKAVESFALRCQQHQFILRHANPLPELMLLDGDRIAQVMQNILSNAVKYSPLGGNIHIFTATDSARISISVQDDGVGMTPDQVDQVFTKFYRAGHTKVQVRGLGLGMNIVKQIVEDHGGVISLSSNPGEGTTVTFTLPIRLGIQPEGV